MGLVPRPGSIELAGEDIVELPTHRIVHRGIGYVPEDSDIFAGLTVAENLGSPSATARALRAGPGTLPDAEASRRQRAGTLSGGEQQMVAIARALLNENRISSSTSRRRASRRRS